MEERIITIFYFIGVLALQVPGVIQGRSFFTHGPLVSFLQTCRLGLNSFVKLDRPKSVKVLAFAFLSSLGLFAYSLVEAVNYTQLNLLESFLVLGWSLLVLFYLASILVPAASSADKLTSAKMMIFFLFLLSGFMYIKGLGESFYALLGLQIVILLLRKALQATAHLYGKANNHIVPMALQFISFFVGCLCLFGWATLLIQQGGVQAVNVLLLFIGTLVSFGLCRAVQTKMGA